LIDPAQLARGFDAHAPSLVLFARQWLSRAAAEDVVQDAFVSLMAQRHPPDNLKAWLFTAVRNAAISCARSQSRRLTRETQEALRRGNWFESRPEDLIDASAAQVALDALPPEQREVIVMRIWAQMTLAEITQVTGQPTSTLFSRYRAGLSEIKRIMESSCHMKKNKI
jgi:RNA polymerase sigma-70 factor (ECF subfamily)